MPDSTDLSTSHDDFDKLDQLCDHFEDAWREGNSLPDLNHYLKDESEDKQKKIFEALFPIDLHYRQRNDKRLSQSEYFKQFPQFKAEIDRELVCPDYLAPDDLIERYRILELVGQGASACVYRALDVMLDRHVAIKLSKAKRRRQPFDVALIEPRIAAQLKHPNIVNVIAAERLDNGHLMIVTDFVDGTTLKHRLAELRATPRKLASIIAKIAGALHLAHQKAIFHRDVSPKNILLDEQDEPYLTDFGLATVVGGIGQSNAVVGTPAYMSPEQARGELNHIDERSDIFSLCAVFYEAITGRRPFEASTIDAVLEIIVSDKPIAAPISVLPSVPGELNRIILKGLQRPAHLRYQNAEELQQELIDWLEDDGETPRQSTRDKIPLTPKGLDYFDEEDSRFFLRLIPGPQGPSRLPESILFWRHRIEARGEASAFPVGILVGPSGSGKSSFVRAGLKPLLRGVHSCVVNATETETEQKLIRALRSEFSGLKKDASADEILRQIQSGHRLSGHQKLLIVIDQFEQYLIGDRNYATDPLIRALRQCDGNHVQALLLVRGDYWDLLTECLRFLDVRVSEENYRPTDAFSPEHARRVLLEFGKAYGCLSGSDSDDLEFAEHVIEELSQDGALLPIQLSFFCRAFRNNAWTIEQLRKAGGIRGVIEDFPEQVVGEDPFLSQHPDEAARVLEALCPETSTLSQQSTKTQKSLSQICTEVELDDDTCQQLMHALERSPLVTRVTDEENQSVFQLAHDHLINVVRAWIDHRLGASWGGRAIQILRRRSEAWAHEQDNRSLPTFTEWLLILTCGSRRPWKSISRQMMRNATSYYLLRALLVAMAIGLGAFGLASVLANSRATNFVRQVESANTSEVPQLIEQGRQLTNLAVRKLKRATEGEDSDIATENGARRMLNLNLVRFGLGDSSVLDRILTLAGIAPSDTPVSLPNPRDLGRAIDVLASKRMSPLRESSQLIAGDSSHDNQVRLAAAAFAARDGSATDDWLTPETCDQLVRGLIAAPPVQLQAWADVMRPLAPKLLPVLESSLLLGEPSSEQNRATLYAAYASDEQLVAAIARARPSQLGILRSGINHQQALRLLQEEFQSQLAIESGSYSENVDDPDTVSRRLAEFQGKAGTAGAFALAIPEAQLDKINHWLEAKRLQLETLRPFTSDNQLYFAATWRPGTGTARYEFGITPAALEAVSMSNEQEGWELVDLAGHPQGATTTFSAVWHPKEDVDHESRCYFDVSADEHDAFIKVYMSDQLSPVRCFADVKSTGETRFSAIWRSLPIKRPEMRNPFVQFGTTNYFPGYLLSDCQITNPLTRIDGGIRHYLTNVIGPPKDLAINRFHRLVSHQEVGQLLLARGLSQVYRDNQDFETLLKRKRLDHTSVLCWTDTVDQTSQLITTRSLEEHYELSVALIDQGAKPATISVRSITETRDGVAVASIWHEPIPTESFMQRRALALSNLALCLARTGDWDPLIQILNGTHGRQAASYVVEHGKVFGLKSDELILLDPKNRSETFAYYLLLALAEIEDDNNAAVQGYLTGLKSEATNVLMAQQYLVKKRELPARPVPDTERHTTNSIGSVMIRVDAPDSGSVVLGMPGWQEYSKPSHTQRERPLVAAYRLSHTEITIDQYRQFVNSPKVQAFYERINHFLAARPAESGDYPQHKVTYFDAIFFCQWLSEQEEIPESEHCYPDIWKSDGVSYNMPDNMLSRTGYRLPTEAEWETACRAGNDQSRHYGSDTKLLRSYAQISGSQSGWLSPVAQRRPNEFGFFDMLGNAAEWCHEPRLRSAEDLELSGHLHVRGRQERLIRGGHYISNTDLSSAYRAKFGVMSLSSQMGFRIAQTIQNE